ncbi:MAG TPA: DUF2892 domain-containing protein [Thermoanaerobaculia bacterium]|nr:DUF2892 domain-containing protein [Thermoanaerobaculia bacterium]
MESSILPRNQTSPERVLRVVVGAAILSLVFVGPKSYWGLLGLIPLLAGLVGSCPLYTLFGINRCPATRR